MIIIDAPYPEICASIVLPSPEWDDTSSAIDVIDVKHAMDGTIYTYKWVHDSSVKAQVEPASKIPLIYYFTPESTYGDRLLFKWRFNMDRDDAMIFWRFNDTYLNSLWAITDHHDNYIIGVSRSNPLVLTPSHRSYRRIDVLDNTSVASHESVSVELEFTGVIRSQI